MSDEGVYHSAPKINEYTATATAAEPESVETTDRGLFGRFRKKEEEKKCEETAISSEFEEKVHVSEPEPEDKRGSLPKSLLDKLTRSDSNSSSSGDEECDENGEKKKIKKKPENIVQHGEDTFVPVEKYEVAHVRQHGPTEPDEKTGFVEKIKEKLPVGHKTEEEGYGAPPPAVVTHADEGEQKGFAEKIKEKLPVGHKTEEEGYGAPPAVVTHADEGEQKGFMEKIKEKQPGGHKKVEEECAAPPPPPPSAVVHIEEGEHKEKKGIFEKIKEKIPGYHSKTEEKETEKVKECD